MFKQIFTIILNQRKNNFWILAELLFVAACLWYIVDYMGVLHSVKNIPLGYNIEDTYRIDLSERTENSDDYIYPANKTTTTGEDLLTVMQLIRKYPEIESVSLSIASQPYLATHYSQIFYNKLSYGETGITAQEYRVTPSFFDVFRTQSVDGKDLKQSLTSHSVIISSNAAAELVKDKSAIGKNILIGEYGIDKQITAEYTPVRWTEYFKANYSFYTLLSEDEIAQSINTDNLSQMELCIRTKPDVRHDFIDRFIQETGAKLMVGNIYLMDVRPISYIREGAVKPEESTIFTRTLLLGFLLINIFLGVSGVFTLRTQQRQSELGLRVALGSTKLKLQLIVIAEGLLLLTVAMVPVVLIALNLGLFELVHIDWLPFTIIRFITGIAITYVIMSIIILTGVWYPAYRTTRINPAEVLRNE